MDDDVLDRLFSGNLEGLPQLNKRIVRLFISSTFTDMSLERNALMEKVYPRLKRYCKEKHGLEFQVVDMRWGVRDEATDDHQTSALCSREILNCQRMSLGPNFVALLGDKYGFRPLCNRIKSNEFRSLRRCLIESDINTNLLDTWYKEDTNCLDAEYILQPISSILVNFNNKLEPELQQNDQKKWFTVQERLQRLLIVASERLVQQGKMHKSDQLKYTLSVTEMEVAQGILNVEEPKLHCLAYIRSIEGLDEFLDSLGVAASMINNSKDNGGKLDEENPKQIASQVVHSLNRQPASSLSVTAASNSAAYYNNMDAEDAENAEDAEDDLEELEILAENDHGDNNDDDNGDDKSTSGQQVGNNKPTVTNGALKHAAYPSDDKLDKRGPIEKEEEEARERQLNMVAKYVDLKQRPDKSRCLDEQARQALRELKRAKLRPCMSIRAAANICQYKMMWDNSEGLRALENSKNEESISSLLEHFYNRMIKLIKRASRQEQKKQSLLSKSMLISEILQHSHYCLQVAKTFHGRHAELEQIRKFILMESTNGGDNQQTSFGDYCIHDAKKLPRLLQLTNLPMLIYGSGGSGKTSLLAKALTLIPTWLREARSKSNQRHSIKNNSTINAAFPCIIMRFLGTTPLGSSLSSTLTIICQQLQYNFYQFDQTTSAHDNAATQFSPSNHNDDNNNSDNNSDNQFQTKASHTNGQDNNNATPSDVNEKRNLMEAPQLAVEPIPEDFVRLVFMFKQLLSNCWHPLHRKRLFIIALDSVDQLSGPQSLEMKFCWLLKSSLPANVRIIISCTSPSAARQNSQNLSNQQQQQHQNQDGIKGAKVTSEDEFAFLLSSLMEQHLRLAEPLMALLNPDELASSFRGTNDDADDAMAHFLAKLLQRNMLHLRPFERQMAIEVMEEWLRSSGRTLTQSQWTILGEALNNCGLPIYLKLAFGEISEWKSYTTRIYSGQQQQPPPNGTLSNLTADKLIANHQESIDHLYHNQHRRQHRPEGIGNSSHHNHTGSRDDAADEAAVWRQQFSDHVNIMNSISIQSTSMYGQTTEPIGWQANGNNMMNGRAFQQSGAHYLSSDVQESINRLFARIELQHGYLLTKHSLSYVTAARVGISENELEDLLSMDDIVLNDVYQYHLPPVRRIPPLLWTRICNDLPNYLSERDSDGIVLQWYHKQFAQVVYERYLSDAQQVNYIHSIMADYFIGRWADKAKPFTYTEAQLKLLASTTSAVGQQQQQEQSNSSKRQSITRVARPIINKVTSHSIQQPKADRRLPAQPLFYSTLELAASSNNNLQAPANGAAPATPELASGDNANTGLSLRATLSQVHNSKEEQQQQQLFKQKKTASLCNPSDSIARRYNLRKLAELPYHLMRSGRFEELCQLVLFNYRWIQAKLCSGPLQSVLVDLMEASKCLGNKLKSAQAIAGATETLPLANDKQQRDERRADSSYNSNNDVGHKDYHNYYDRHNDDSDDDVKFLNTTGNSNQHLDTFVGPDEPEPKELKFMMKQIKLLIDTLRLSSSVLHTQPDMLAPHLLGRLMPMKKKKKKKEKNSNSSNNNSNIKKKEEKLETKKSTTGRQHNYIGQLLSQCDLHGCQDCSLLPTDHCLQTPNGPLVCSLEDHLFAVWDFAITSDQRYILSISNKFVMWDIATGEKSRDVSPNIEGLMIELKVTSDDQFAIAYTNLNVVVVMNILTQQVTLRDLNKPLAKHDKQIVEMKRNEQQVNDRNRLAAGDGRVHGGNSSSHSSREEGEAAKEDEKLNQEAQGEEQQVDHQAERANQQNERGSPDKAVNLSSCRAANKICGIQLIEGRQSKSRFLIWTEAHWMVLSIVNSDGSVEFLPGGEDGNSSYIIDEQHGGDDTLRNENRGQELEDNNRRSQYQIKLEQLESLESLMARAIEPKEELAKRLLNSQMGRLLTRKNFKILNVRWQEADSMNIRSSLVAGKIGKNKPSNSFKGGGALIILTLQDRKDKSIQWIQTCQLLSSLQNTSDKNNLFATGKKHKQLPNNNRISYKIWPDPVRLNFGVSTCNLGLNRLFLCGINYNNQQTTTDANNSSNATLNGCDGCDGQIFMYRLRRTQWSKRAKLIWTNRCELQTTTSNSNNLSALFKSGSDSNHMQQTIAHTLIIPTDQKEGQCQLSGSDASSIDKEATTLVQDRLKSQQNLATIQTGDTIERRPSYFGYDLAQQIRKMSESHELSGTSLGTIKFRLSLDKRCNKARLPLAIELLETSNNDNDNNNNAVFIDGKDSQDSLGLSGTGKDARGVDNAESRNNENFDDLLSNEQSLKKLIKQHSTRLSGQHYHYSNIDLQQRQTTTSDRPCQTVVVAYYIRKIVVIYLDKELRAQFKAEKDHHDEQVNGGESAINEWSHHCVHLPVNERNISIGPNKCLTKFQLLNSCRLTNRAYSSLSSSLKNSRPFDYAIGAIRNTLFMWSLAKSGCEGQLLRQFDAHHGRILQVKQLKQQLDPTLNYGHVDHDADGASTTNLLSASEVALKPNFTQQHSSSLKRGDEHDEELDFVGGNGRIGLADLLIASASMDRTIKIWNLSNVFEESHNIKRLSMPVEALSLAKQRPLVAGLTNKEVGIWDWRTIKLLATCHPVYMHSIGDAANDANNQDAATMGAPVDSMITCVRLSANGLYLAVGQTSIVQQQRRQSMDIYGKKGSKSKDKRISQQKRDANKSNQGHQCQRHFITIWNVDELIQADSGSNQVSPHYGQFKSLGLESDQKLSPAPPSNHSYQFKSTQMANELSTHQVGLISQMTMPGLVRVLRFFSQDSRLMIVCENQVPLSSDNNDPILDDDDDDRATSITSNATSGPNSPVGDTLSHSGVSSSATSDHSTTTMSKLIKRVFVQVRQVQPSMSIVNGAELLYELDYLTPTYPCSTLSFKSSSSQQQQLLLWMHNNNNNSKSGAGSSMDNKTVTSSVHSNYSATTNTTGNNHYGTKQRQQRGNLKKRTTTNNSNGSGGGSRQLLQAVRMPILTRDQQYIVSVALAPHNNYNKQQHFPVGGGYILDERMRRRRQSSIIQRPPIVLNVHSSRDGYLLRAIQINQQQQQHASAPSVGVTSLIAAASPSSSTNRSTAHLQVPTASSTVMADQLYLSNDNQFTRIKSLALYRDNRSSVVALIDEERGTTCLLDIYTRQLLVQFNNWCGKITRDGRYGLSWFSLLAGAGAGAVATAGAQGILNGVGKSVHVKPLFGKTSSSGLELLEMRLGSSIKLLISHSNLANIQLSASAGASAPSTTIKHQVSDSLSTDMDRQSSQSTLGVQSAVSGTANEIKFCSFCGPNDQYVFILIGCAQTSATSTSSVSSATSNGGLLLLIRIRDGQLLAKYRPSSEVTQIKVSSDRYALILAAVDGTITTLMISDPDKVETQAKLAQLPSRLN